MKPLKLLKALINLAPIAAIALLGFLVWNNKERVSADAGADQKMSRHLKVDRVLDGDTIKLQNGESVRLCGIDAPEKSQRLGLESKAKLQQLIEQAGNDVILVEVERDRYGRIVGEVFVRNKASQNPGEEFFANGEMLASGMAYHYEKYSANCGRSILEAAEQSAKSNRLGVWKADYQRPWDFRKAQRE